MHGGRRPFHRQGQPVIELLELCNVIGIARSLAHAPTITPRDRLPRHRDFLCEETRRHRPEKEKARREGTQTGPLEALAVWRIPTPRSLCIHLIVSSGGCQYSSSNLVKIPHSPWTDKGFL
jgi:hypothetical protein